MPKTHRKVLITGGNFNNQGAFLMLYAAAGWVRDELDALPVVDGDVGDADLRAWFGLGTLLSYPNRSIYLRLPRLPRRMTKYASLAPFISADQIDAVLDISGFAFGDQWEDLDLNRRAANFERWKNRGVPTYILPQAFGPFENTASPSKRFIRAARLAYIRDDSSLAAAHELLADDAESLGKLRTAPDFTVGLKGSGANGHSHLSGGVPIVPNWNIRDRAGGDGSRYVNNLAVMATVAADRGLRPYGLCHEGARDEAVLHEVKSLVGHDFEIVTGLSGLEAKHILSKARFAISGRFHAIVSAMSSGVPTLMHGWSHKYEWLAADFDARDLIVDPYGSPDKTAASVNNLLDHLPEMKARVTRASATLQSQSKDMWDEIREDLQLQWAAV